MEDLYRRCIELPKYAHSAIICGQTGCGKTEFVLDLLELSQQQGGYAGVFENIVILCPTIAWNKAYKNRSWIGDVWHPRDKKIKIVNPVNRNGEEKLQELLRLFFNKYAGSPTLYIIDDCSATKQLTKKKEYAITARIFRAACGTNCLGHIAEIQFSFKRLKRTNEMAVHVLYERQR